MKKSNPLKYFNDQADARKKALMKAQNGINNQSDTVKTPSKDLWKEGLMIGTRQTSAPVENTYVRPTGGDEYTGSKKTKKMIKKLEKKMNKSQPMF